MISVKVSYTVKPDFVAQNKKNIGIFLADLRKLTSINFLYNVFLEDDGLTFLHVSMYENEEVQQTLMSVPSFKNFQKERDESGLNNSHQLAHIQLIGTSLSVI